MFSRIGTFLYIAAGVVILGTLLFRLGRPATALSAASSSQIPVSRHDHAAMLFRQNCALCHGDDGNGAGPAAIVLDPRPRSFVVGKYKLITSNNLVPYKDDIKRTIRNGMPGTSMPAWSFLSDDEIDMLADYVLDISSRSLRTQLEQKKLKPNVIDNLIKARTTPTGALTIPPQTPRTEASLTRGKELYAKNCATCHAADGSGKQDPQWKTDEGHAIASRNFTSNVFKGGGRTEDLYTRLYSGMPGTPMPSFAGLSPQDLWDTIHFVKTLADPKTNPGAVPPAK